MIKIDKEFTNGIVKQAEESPRLRKNYNYHRSYNEVVNRMLNALQKDTYVHPHKHEEPDKHEVFIILTGKAAVIEFDQDGNITDSFILEAESGKFGVEIAPRVWHTIIALTDGTVVYEVKEGPYSPINDKNFATWAPKEGNESCKAFNMSLLQQIGYANKQ
jgi:cupin fold WbuC family metalloprotein